MPLQLSIDQMYESNKEKEKEKEKENGAQYQQGKT